jgi:hypothetical protein
MRDLYLFVLSVKEQWRRILTGSLVLAVIGLVQGIGKIRIPSGAYWVILLVTLFWSVFGVWKTERDAKAKTASRTLSLEETQKITQTFVLAERLMQMMYNWPTSPAVANPFTIGWRPLVGQTDIPVDQQQVMEWRRDCEAHLTAIAKGDWTPEMQEIKLFGVLSQKDFHIVSLACLSDFAEIEKRLLERVLN